MPPVWSLLPGPPTVPSQRPSLTPFRLGILIRSQGPGPPDPACSPHRGQHGLTELSPELTWGSGPSNRGGATEARCGETLAGAGAWVAPQTLDLAAGAGTCRCPSLHRHFTDCAVSKATWGLGGAGRRHQVQGSSRWGGGSVPSQTPLPPELASPRPAAGVRGQRTPLTSPTPGAEEASGAPAGGSCLRAPGAPGQSAVPAAATHLPAEATRASARDRTGSPPGDGSRRQAPRAGLGDSRVLPDRGRGRRQEAPCGKGSNL